MTTYLAIMGLTAFRLGLTTTVDEDGVIELLSPCLAGTGMATFLGVMAAQALS